MIMLDKFQKEAIDSALSGYSVLVSAPTGAGKTLIAEKIIEHEIQNGKRVVYTAPIKALSNQKFRDFYKKFNANAGIITGDVVINPNASIIIMTTEIFRNKVLIQSDSMKQFTWVILDEFHFIDDHDRGTVWEEALIFMPEWMKFLGLSATATNIREIAEWIEKIHGKIVKVVMEDKRPVPLKIIFYRNGKFSLDIDSTMKTSQIWDYKEDDYKSLNDIISYIKDNNMFPCIYFTFSRQRCSEIADYVSSLNLITSTESILLEKKFNEILYNFDLEDDPYCSEIMPLIKKGVAFHHAGLVPTVKEAIEELFSTGKLKFISTTETFALGINMPAKTCVFENIIKYSNGHKRYLRSREFHQMAGRAGRRGMDKIGYVIIKVPDWNINIIKEIVYSSPEPIKSKFNPSYSTILNIYKKFPNNPHPILLKSLYNYQLPNNFKEHILKNIIRKISVLKELGYIKDKNLSTKGYFASKIFGGELIISELLTNKYLENMNELELIATLSSIVLDKSKSISKKQPEISQIVKNVKSIVLKTYKRLRKIESEAGVKSGSRKPNFTFSDAMLLWAKGEKLFSIADKFKIYEGDIIWHARRIIQTLRQINQISEIPPKLRQKIMNATKLIKKDIVDQERNLSRLISY